MKDLSEGLLKKKSVYSFYLLLTHIFSIYETYGNVESIPTLYDSILHYILYNTINIDQIHFYKIKERKSKTI